MGGRLDHASSDRGPNVTRQWSLGPARWQSSPVRLRSAPAVSQKRSFLAPQVGWLQSLAHAARSDAHQDKWSTSTKLRLPRKVTLHCHQSVLSVTWSFCHSFFRCTLQQHSSPTLLSKTSLCTILFSNFSATLTWHQARRHRLMPWIIFHWVRFYAVFFIVKYLISFYLIYVHLINSFLSSVFKQL